MTYNDKRAGNVVDTVCNHQSCEDNVAIANKSVVDNSKNPNNRSQNRNRRNWLQIPEIINIDTLALIADDELRERLYALNSTIIEIEASNSKQPTNPWETEACYIQRELMIRSIRRDKHDQYVRSLRFDVEDESEYPMGDFDNIVFIRLNSQRSQRSTGRNIQ